MYERRSTVSSQLSAEAGTGCRTLAVCGRANRGVIEDASDRNQTQADNRTIGSGPLRITTARILSQAFFFAAFLGLFAVATYVALADNPRTHHLDQQVPGDRPARRPRHRPDHPHDLQRPGLLADHAAGYHRPGPRLLQLDLPLRHPPPFHRLGLRRAAPPSSGSRSTATVACTPPSTHPGRHARGGGLRQPADRPARPDRLHPPLLHRRRGASPADRRAPATFGDTRIYQLGLGHRLHAPGPGRHEPGHPAVFLPRALPAGRVPGRLQPLQPLADRPRPGQVHRLRPVQHTAKAPADPHTHFARASASSASTASRTARTTR